MDVLIVRKTTNFELHGDAVKERAERGAVPADVMARLQDAHTEHYRTLDFLREHLTAKSVSFEVISRDDQLPADTGDIVVTVGGDGTLLAASHKLTNQKLLGVRSSASSVGYLCAADEKTIPEWVERIAAGDLTASPVTRAAAKISRADAGTEVETSPVLNDILYTNSNPAATTRYAISVGDKRELHRSSGLWIATGTGSTAAIFAAGGEQYPADDPRIQYRVRELYKLGLSVPTIESGFVLPGKDRLVIENRCESALLAVDGQHGTYPLGYGDTVEVIAAQPLQLVRKT